MNRRDRRVAARHSRSASNVPSVSTPAELYEAGLRHLRAGEHLEAQLCCQRAFAAEPDYADALYLMGLLSAHAAQHDLAIEWFARAIRREVKLQYVVALAMALRNQGRLEEALKAFDKAVQLKPDGAELWKHLGHVLISLNRPDQAALNFQHALALNPRDWDAAFNVGSLLFYLQRFDEALASFDLCKRLQPNHGVTLRKRALTLYRLERLEEALDDIKQAHVLDPQDAAICNDAGAFLQRLRRDDEAVTWFDRALGLRPDYPEAFMGKASSLTHLHRFDEAFITYDAMKVLHPDDVKANWARSLLDLLTGNFDAGWAGREVRGNFPDSPLAHFKYPQPRWLGKEPIEGKTILVPVDEGLGDAIQFSRYIPMLAARGARVILVVQNVLCPLLSKVTGVSQCLPLSAATMSATTLPAFDMYCPISSLPLAFGTTFETIPSASYLPAPAAALLETWEARLGSHDRLRVGLVWSGNPSHDNDHNRSLSLRALTSILDLDATFVSLQKDLRPDDRAALLEQTDIVDFAGDLTDFAETAALVSCLDLVITVDTSVAHLAGALGRPTWILLPYTPDYRWLLDRDNSPWYPSARLFRQGESRDYANVIDCVRAELIAMISTLELAAK
jgi:tetratricopeptide (TPR) repeat protein